MEGKKENARMLQAPPSESRVGAILFRCALLWIAMPIAAVAGSALMIWAWENFSHDRKISDVEARVEISDQIERGSSSMILPGIILLLLAPRRQLRMWSRLLAGAAQVFLLVGISAATLEYLALLELIPRIVIYSTPLEEVTSILNVLSWTIWVWSLPVLLIAMLLQGLRTHKKLMV